MTNENETVAEICHEMHLHEINGQWVNGYEVGRLADRIDAAHKREIAYLDGRPCQHAKPCPCLPDGICEGCEKEKCLKGGK